MDSVLKALLIYVVLWLLIRISGRRTLAELSTFDLILFLIIGGATQRALIGQDYSLINAFVVITTLIVIDILVGLVERDFSLINKIIERARTLHGLETLEQIKYAILEASGEISIIPREKPPRRAGK